MRTVEAYDIVASAVLLADDIRTKWFSLMVAGNICLYPHVRVCTYYTRTHTGSHIHDGAAVLCQTNACAELVLCCPTLTRRSDACAHFVNGERRTTTAMSSQVTYGKD